MMLTILNQERNGTIKFSKRQTREGSQRLKLAEAISCYIVGLMTAWCGERYRVRIGWTTTLFLDAMAIGAAFGFGVTR
ncbi:MAG TPA: hypothetical protein VN494_12040 [Patescibacteria group bacterium]|nr:hypothetical protein [Patescibacteria group bacterium]